MGPSPPRTAKEAAKEVAQAEDSAATEEDSDTDVDEEDEGWDDADDGHEEREVDRAVTDPTQWPPQVPPCNYGEQCYSNCYP